MFSFLKGLLAKISLSEFLRNLELDIDPVQKSGGNYHRVQIHVFEFKALDRYVPTPGGGNIDIRINVGGIDNGETLRPDELDRIATRNAKETLKAGGVPGLNE